METAAPQWSEMASQTLYESLRLEHHGLTGAALVRAQDALEFSGKALLTSNDIDFEPDHNQGDTLGELAQQSPRHHGPGCSDPLLRSIAEAHEEFLAGSQRNQWRYERYDTGTQNPEASQLLEALKRAAITAFGAATHDLAAQRFGSPNPRIAVLDGRLTRTTAPSMNPQHNAIEATNWQDKIETALRKRDVPDPTVALAPTQRIGPDVAMVVNPWGERYPEADVAGWQTLHRIERFIFGGGVFVNLGGLPFWEGVPVDGPNRTQAGAWDEWRDDTPPGHISLAGCAFKRWFGADVTGDTRLRQGPSRVDLWQTDSDRDRFGELPEGPQQGIPEYRSVRRRGDGHRIRPLVRAKRPDHGEIYPIAAVRYGAGALVSVALDFNRTELGPLGAWAVAAALGRAQARADVTLETDDEATGRVMTPPLSRYGRI